MAPRHAGASPADHRMSRLRSIRPHGLRPAHRHPPGAARHEAVWRPASRHRNESTTCAEVNGLICDGARGPRLNALDLTVSTMHAEAMQSSASRHLKQLESESIYILREAVAEFRSPVMLYSVGKDSSVLLHLAMKAFYPAKPPFPLMHIDTTWKFREMIAFRDRTADLLGLELIVHVNEEGVREAINPTTHGSTLFTDVMKTQALRQALEKHSFDAAIAGARREEEKSRAKERIFSFRNKAHRWDPKSQRPELWRTFNTRIKTGESMRVFPLSNWTELDIWTYIHLEQIPVVPLYFAKERPVVEREGMLIMVDDDRLPLNVGEKPQMSVVRFRTLGCYPLTGAIESGAMTVPEVIEELLLTRLSERQGRVIDQDQSGSMERKKQEGYF